MPSHLSIASAEPATISSRARRISGGQWNGLDWTVYRIEDDFCFRAEAAGAVLHTSPATFETAPKAERAAREWCAKPHTEVAAALQPEPPSAPPAAPPAAGGQGIECSEILHKLEVSGWLLALAYSTAAADFAEATASADEFAQLQARLREVDEKMAELKDEKALLTKQLGSRANTAVSLIRSISRGERGLVYQQRIPFASSPETREVVGELAQKAVEKLSSRAASQGRTAKVSIERQPAAGTEAWSHNGVDYIIEHQTTSNAAGPLSTAWIRGHRYATEGFHEQLDQAIEACKGSAAIVFADLAPGEAPAAGPPTPAKKAKGPKLKGHDRTAVLAAVARTENTVAASVEIGCTPQQLEKYAEKNDIDLKVDLPPAPQAKAGKARGRRKAGGK